MQAARQFSTALPSSSSPGCGDHVFAKNPVCRKCQTPNPNGPTVGLPCGGGPAAITPKPGDAANA
eukprot:2426867-Pyramimonas_sp.AAC.1